MYTPLGASLYSFAYHAGLCAFIFGNTCSLCLSISPSTMDLETMIHAEIQPEDELTVTDRAIVDRVRGLSRALGCTHLTNC